MFRAPPIYCIKESRAAKRLFACLAVRDAERKRHLVGAGRQTHENGDHRAFTD
jgi:hypothetical protein